MNKFTRIIVALLAVVALGLGIPMGAASPAEAAVRQRIVNSSYSDRSLLVAKYFDGKGTDRVVRPGSASPYVPTRSFYIPKGCSAQIAKGNLVVSKRKTSGWNNLGPKYATGHWKIELWCKKNGGGGSW